MALVVYTGPGSLNTIEQSYCNDDNRQNCYKKYVGLSNQGATCYLNSLLQTLFMTPEFRRAIFAWHYDKNKDADEEVCIPLQLQRLFGLLQIGQCTAVETRDLTRSFGWEGSEAFQQQDIQELTRVLFDALEETFKGTEVENVIDQLYAGELIDYIRCIDIEYQSERVDKFLDLSFAIVPFGSKRAMHSLNECIEMFLRPELLDEDNKYYAEVVDKKVDAIKGLKFGKLPQIMSCNLKRFVYDLSGGYVTQKKLNDVVRFPLVLDMNKYVSKRSRSMSLGSYSQDKTTGLSEHKDGQISILGDETSNTNEDLVTNEEFEKFLIDQMNQLKDQRSQQIRSNPSGESSLGSSVADLDDIDLEDPSVPDLVNSKGEKSSCQLAEEMKLNAEKKSWSKEEIEDLVKLRGEWVYELYSVMIHAGEINGGHYYAYIKDLDSSQWYDFNDSRVSPIEEQKVQEAWGGVHSYCSTVNGITSTVSTMNRANAYMLMYRKVTSKAVTFPDDSSIPQYIRDEVKKRDEEASARLKAAEELRNKLELKIYWNNEEYIIHTSRKHTYAALLRQLWDYLHLQDRPEFCVEMPESEHKSETAPDFNPEEECKSYGNGRESKVPLDQMRLRFYNLSSKMGTDVLDFNVCHNRTLEDLMLSTFRPLMLETRAVSQLWEVYYPDGVSINVDEFDLETMAFKGPRCVRLPRLSTSKDLIDVIASWMPYPKEELRVIKCTTLAYIDGKMDILDYDNRKLKEDLFINDYSKIYCERIVPGESQAFLAFLAMRSRMTFSYNKPPSMTFTEKIQADGRWTVGTLRKKIADALGLNDDSIRLLKSNVSGPELKDNSVKLATAALYENASICVLLGKMLPMGMFNIQLFYYETPAYQPGCMILPDDCETSSNPNEDFEGTELKEINLSSLNPHLHRSIIPSIEENVKHDTDYFVEVSEAVDFVEVDNGMEGDRVEVMPEMDVRDTAAEDMECMGLESTSSRYHHVGEVEAVAVPIDVRPISDSESESINSKFSSIPLLEAVAVTVAHRQSIAQMPPAPEVLDEEWGDGIEAASCNQYENFVVTKPAPVTSLTIEGDNIEPNDFGQRSVLAAIQNNKFTVIEGLEAVHLTNETKISEAREEIANRLKALGRLPHDATPQHIRIREKAGTRLDRILRDGKTFSQHDIKLYDSKPLAIQILSEPEDLGPETRGDHLMLIQRWHRDRWELGPCQEVYMSGNRKISSIAKGLGIKLNIDPENLKALVVFNHNDIALYHLDHQFPKKSTRPWFTPFKEQSLLKDMYMLHNCDLLLIQDSSEQLRELTAADKLSIQLVEAAERSYPSYSYPTQVVPSSRLDSLMTPSTRVRSQGVKITVHHKGDRKDTPSPALDESDREVVTEGVALFSNIE